MSSPLDWFHRTFRNRAATEQLLGPELENGLTRHDYELALRFLPGPSRYLPFAYSLFTGSMVAAYGMVYRRPRWSLPRASLLCSFAGITGLMYGQFKQVYAHYLFTQSLENPATFMEALENVNIKMGGTRPLNFAMKGTRHKRKGIETETETDTSAQDTGAIEFAKDDGWDVNRDGERSKASGPVSTAPSSSPRWEEIRAANARATAQSSTWDALRQKHEKDRIRNVDKGGQEQNESSSINDRVS